jgi:predicted component of type VI protein secretion system
LEISDFSRKTRYEPRLSGEIWLTEVFLREKDENELRFEVQGEVIFSSTDFRISHSSGQHLF